MKIIQDKKEYDIRRVVGKRIKLKYDIEKKEVVVAPPAGPTQEELLTQIRDLLKK